MRMDLATAERLLAPGPAHVHLKGAGAAVQQLPNSTTIVIGLGQVVRASDRRADAGRRL
jgi:hypothetical protein